MRVGLGNVLTITATEVWLSELRAGRAFGRGTFLAAVAAVFSEIQLFNPAASGKQIIVRAVLLSPGVATSINVRFHNVALATLVGTGVNLLSGGAAGVGELRTAQPAAEDGTLLGPVQDLANTSIQPAPDWMCELSPGQGVLIDPSSVNIALNAFFFWREV